MIQAFYNGLSGLFSYAKGLKNVSANVANMNTPGFRGTDTFFRNVGGHDGGALGVEISASAPRTAQGELRQSGNATDFAINGLGFFVLDSEDGERYYTRAGQFRLDEEFRLVDAVSGHRVQALGSSNSLAGVDLSALRVQAPEATTRVEFSGNLVRSVASGGNTHTVSNVEVFDTTGATVTLNVQFTQQATDTSRWDVVVSSSALGNVGSGVLAFGPDDRPAVGQNTLDVLLNSNGRSQTITLDFGSPGSLDAVTSFSSATSQVAANVTDGHAFSGLAGVTVDEKGVLELTYADGRKQDGPQLALAQFTNESALQQRGDALYVAGTLTPQFGSAGSGALGRVQGGYLELSNVDLAQEFGDLIIIQRGYQASSRVMTVASEMIEQLYGNGRGS
jgi:flagellar hook protein FlgE